MSDVGKLGLNSLSWICLPVNSNGHTSLLTCHMDVPYAYDWRILEPAISIG